MDFKGYHILKGIRYCRISHWDGFDYLIPWRDPENKPSSMYVKLAIDDWWLNKEKSDVKRFS